MHIIKTSHLSLDADERLNRNGAIYLRRHFIQTEESWFSVIAQPVDSPRGNLTSKIASLTSFNMKGPSKVAPTISVQSTADVDKFNKIRIWMGQTTVLRIESFETDINRLSIL